jgi:hypothetical protein
VTTKNVVFWDVALCFGGTSVDARSTQRHIPEDDILNCFGICILSTGNRDVHLIDNLMVSVVINPYHASQHNVYIECSSEHGSYIRILLTIISHPICHVVVLS